MQTGWKETWGWEMLPENCPQNLATYLCEAEGSGRVENHSDVLVLVFGTMAIPTYRRDTRKRSQLFSKGARPRWSFRDRSSCKNRPPPPPPRILYIGRRKLYSEGLTSPIFQLNFFHPATNLPAFLIDMVTWDPGSRLQEPAENVF